ncbi:MAG TPA: hypothetical protein DDX19_17425 [Rhodopirellula baltica]|uniref:Uncharacterized protein n=1 Tax=Rhodopirellula baltica (strain DSM 10527 / NCIMB 13988 / SH1) TaxID=243090 RepID=Q7UEX8_RHOBA|nr:hypothetical protein RB10481 [Rhodopirellula baltica SH 1]HBE64485.1 hypothetical protein [Rhodopirellula baltica]
MLLPEQSTDRFVQKVLILFCQPLLSELGFHHPFHLTWFNVWFLKTNQKNGFLIPASRFRVATLGGITTLAPNTRISTYLFPF